MLNFNNCYQNLSDEMKLGISALWKGEGALEDEAAISERLNQIVYVIVDSETGSVAGVSTAEKKKVNLLNGNRLYELRCYIGENFRIAGLDIKISKLTIDFLHELSLQDPEKPIGVFTVLQNEFLQTQPLWRRAVWPETQMYFVGYTKAGDPIRVHYFKGARI